jgi:hypothetical protein
MQPAYHLLILLLYPALLKLKSRTASNFPDSTNRLAMGQARFVNLRGYLIVYVNLCWATGQFIVTGVCRLTSEINIRHCQG